MVARAASDRGDFQRLIGPSRERYQLGCLDALRDEVFERLVRHWQSNGVVTPELEPKIEQARTMANRDQRFAQLLRMVGLTHARNTEPDARRDLERAQRFGVCSADIVAAVRGLTNPDERSHIASYLYELTESLFKR